MVVPRRKIPSTVQLVKKTAYDLGYIPGDYPADAARSAFDAVLRDLFEKTLPLLEEYEQGCGEEELFRILVEERPARRAEVSRLVMQEGVEPAIRFLLHDCYADLRALHLSISQGRKSRGGSHFEAQLHWMLSLAGFPWQRAERELNVDLVLPSRDLFRRNRASAVLVSVKRTLRERWEVGLEALQSHRCRPYVVTASDRPEPAAVAGITGRGVELVVWDQVKREELSANEMVLGYTEWVCDRLALAERYWPLS